MFAVIETATGVALHLLDTAPEITGSGMVAPVRAPDIKAGTHSVIEVDKPEFIFAPGVLSFFGEEWGVANQDAYDALVATRLEAKKRAKRAAVTALLDAKLTGGYPHDFGAPYGTKVLQTRNIEDRTNWLTSQASYSAAIAAGAGAVMGANFRTEDNININLSYSDGLGVLLAMAGWGDGLYAKSWALKDAIDAAGDDATVDAIDIESGW